MTCKLCQEESLKNEEYCKSHYIEVKEEEFCDLTTGGFFKWVDFFLREYMPQKSPKMHEEIVSLFFSLYNPYYVNTLNRQLEEIAYREAGKSTVLNFFIPLFIACHNGKEITIWAEVPDGEGTMITKVKVKLKERFGVIASKTGTIAEEFVSRMRDELTTNQRLQMFYGTQIEDDIDSKTGQWTRRAFKFNNCWILGRGTLMMIRGIVKGAYRPTFMIFDDIYDETNTTDIQRGKIKRWFYGAAMNSLDSLNGKALLAGTILHEDTVLVECEKASLWKTAKFYPMPLRRFKDLLKHLQISEANRICLLPFDNEPNEVIRTTKQINYFKELQGKEDWGLAWAERHDLYYMITKYKNAVETSSISTYYQEYFHEPIDESQKKFKQDYFQRIKGQWRLFKQFGYVWFECKELYPDPQIINIEVGCDIAGITAEADNCAIQPLGALPDHRLIVFPASYGKMSSRDVLKQDSASLFRYEKVILEKEYIEKTGFSDEVFRTAIEYRPSTVKIGVAGDENRTPEDVRLLFNANELYIQVLPRPQKKDSGSKYERIRFTLLKYYESLSVFHTNGCTQLELELEKLTKYPTDDIADALEVAAFNIQFPAGLSYQSFTQPNFSRDRGYRKNIKSIANEPRDWRVN